ncbi:MAG: thioredoxin family protein [Planctomycetota bacterium]|nr:thioredoxin family protein [Planctomycetota bacterium]
MSSDQAPKAPSADSEATHSKGKRGRFWQVFWLSFLVVSLAFLWHSFYAPSNDIAWAEDFPAAQQQAATADKPMLLFFTGKWCSPCQIMKRQVWADDQVADTVNEALIPVTIDVDDPGAVTVLRSYAVGVTPTTILCDPTGKVLQREQGRLSKAQFLEMLGELDPAAAGAL